MFLRRIPIFLLLLGLAALPGNAQSRRSIYNIGGNIRDAGDRHAMENVPVSLRQSIGVPIKTVYTTANGDFDFDGLAKGDYIIEIDVKDYQRVEQAVTVSGNSLLGISIALVRSQKLSAPIAQGSISAHQLSVPRKAHDEFEKGMTLIYLKSDYLGGINQLQLAIRDFPTYYEAYAEVGNAYYQLKELDHAEEAMRKSVDLSSGQYPDALFNLSALLTDTMRYTEAETLSRKGISADKSSWRGPYELARALTGLKQTEEAEKNAEQARGMMPENPTVFLLLANIHIQKRDYPALVKDLDEFLRLSPNSPEADQARKTRERVQAAMNTAKSETVGSGQEEPQDDQDDEDFEDAAPEKDAAPATGKNTPGLPSLPPSTQENR
jgi:tetratricopeptide (TPR) repeat protein